jgi:hypothetical protein
VEEPAVPRLATTPTEAKSNGRTEKMGACCCVTSDLAAKTK